MRGHRVRSGLTRCNPRAKPAGSLIPYPRSVRSGTEQRVGGGAAGLLSPDLGAAAFDLLLEHGNPFLQLGDAVELEVLAHRLGQPLPAADPDARRFFHVEAP